MAHKVLNADELRLLEELSTGSVGRLEPSARVGPDGAEYPAAEPHLPNAEHVGETLRSLADEGYLVTEDERTVHICPGCESERMRLGRLCVTCGSTETYEHEIIEHLSCGCTRPRTDFETDGGDYVCPNCGGAVEALGIDYAKMGTQHICGDCGDRFDAPDHRFVCDGCNGVVAPSDAIELDVQAFEFDESCRERLDAKLFVKHDLEERLRDRGFAVSTNTTIRGASGREYPIHLHARDDLLDVSIAVSVAERPTDDGLARLTLLREDADARPILVAFGPPDDESTSSLADRLGVTIIRADEYQDGTAGRDGEQAVAVEHAIEATSPTTAD